MGKLLLTLCNTYKFIAINFLSAIIVFCLINSVAAHLVFKQEQQNEYAGSSLEKYGPEKMRAAYPDWDFQDILKFNSNKTLPRVRYEYEAFTQFRHLPIRTPFINFSIHGYRFNESEVAWPPAKDKYVIFVFGGSTTFGFTRDNRTIPACLERVLKARSANNDTVVYNFGRVGYFSTQERILFENLLMQDIRPNLAIFIDGLNDFTFYSGVPDWTNSLRDLMQTNSDPKEVYQRSLRTIIDGISINRLLKGAKKEDPIPKAQPALVGDQAWGLQEFGKPDIINDSIKRLEYNRSLIETAANLYGIKTLFVLQPVPTYQYELKHHLFFEGDPAVFREARRSYFGYRALAAKRSELEKSENFVWLADLQSSAQENLYVDIVHYTDSFSERIAQELADVLIKKKLCCK